MLSVVRALDDRKPPSLLGFRRARVQMCYFRSAIARRMRSAAAATSGLRGVARPQNPFLTLALARTCCPSARASVACPMTATRVALASAWSFRALTTFSRSQRRERTGCSVAEISAFVGMAFTSALSSLTCLAIRAVFDATLAEAASASLRACAAASIPSARASATCGSKTEIQVVLGETTTVPSLRVNWNAADPFSAFASAVTLAVMPLLLETRSVTMRPAAPISSDLTSQPFVLMVTVVASPWITTPVVPVDLIVQGDVAACE